MPRRRAVVEESQRRMNKGKFEKSVAVAHVYNPRFPWDAHANHFRNFRGLAREHTSAMQCYSPCLLHSVLSIGDLS